MLRVLALCHRAKLFLVRSATAADSRNFDRNLSRVFCVIVGRRGADDALRNPSLP